MIKEREIVCPKCKEQIGAGYFTTEQAKSVQRNHNKNEHKK